MTEASPLSLQIGGDWYSRLAIQPVEVAMKNHWDACAFMALQYLTRHRAKDGRKDLAKARHCLALRRHFSPNRRPGPITCADYLRENAIHLDDALAIAALWRWVEDGGERHYIIAQDAIDWLMAECYPLLTCEGPRVAE